MEKLCNIEPLIDDLVSSIKDSDKYKRYILVRDKIKLDNDIMTRIKRVKSLQKEIVNLKYKNKDYKDKDIEIDNILKELNSYPIYVEYDYLVEDLNYEIKYIKDSIEDEINKIVS